MKIKSKLELLKEWHNIAVEREDTTLYYHDEEIGKWCALQESDEILSCGIVSSYDEEVEVTITDNSFGDERIKEYVRTTKFICLEHITEFKLCSIQPETYADKIKALEKIISTDENQKSNP